ncbi:nitrate ABC transporter substrate-binding protein [Scytonema hofmannii PCC 7110]|uniref:Nitrate ABC transporter substrate-binding protein n=1 Tax=Scytonema hofmannii PCC 7110 TaxID=128403 RepID=A0A139XHA1_9CYAN|nr:ABC transporter substrate-binding protein [Scytonema hofmannii]KYC44074.1 nitrate ABC transporter substrate-binding protein [Scytonema hofmannii PCC 7110]
MIRLQNSLSTIQTVNRRQFIKYGSMALGSSIFTACSSGNQSLSGGLVSTVDPEAKSRLDKVNFILSWVAEAEYGGFYQALATGIYKDYGLDVSITQGGPRMSAGLLLMRGAANLIMGSGGEAIVAVETGVPKVTVAAIFQKDPQVLIAHPGVGNDLLEQMKGKPILTASAASATYWPFLKLKYGFTDSQQRPYNFKIEPFLADKNMIQQGIVTAEPFEIEKKGGFKPVVILLADRGYNSYNFTIDTTVELVENNSELVQRFVDASIKGWYNYLEQPTPGNELIKKYNPEMTDEQIAYSVKKIKEYNLITGGDAANLGIGAMTKERWKSFFDGMVEAGVFKSTTKYEDAFTLQFVNKGVQAYKS